MKKGLFFLLLASIIGAGETFGQGGGTPPSSSFKPTQDFLTKMGEILPNAPNTAAIVKYGGIDIEMNTGVVKKSIELKPFSSRNISVPINLGFNSMGLRVTEYPTRVGIGWHLQAGGVISRVIYGKDDLIAQRYVPTSILSPNDEDTYTTTFCVKLNYEGNRDATPDMFSYNFGPFSGKFIFDNNGTIRPLQATNIKFYYNPSLQSSGEWKFKAITPDGTQYFFGASGAVESTKIGATRFFNDFVPNAWHITKIIDPHGYYVNFVYEEQQYGPIVTDIEETVVSNAPGCGEATCPTEQNPNPPNGCLMNNYETRYMTARASRLVEINDLDGDKVLFTYSAVGYPELLVNEIAYYVNTSSLVSKYTLNYAYENPSGGGTIPFLTSIVETGSQGAPISLGHRFTYYSRSAVPKRFSYSQDHWGYYNGKYNTTLVPVPEDQQMALKFPQATANREPDPNYAVIGLLSEITYPTGGKDVITYEPNTISAVKDVNGYQTLSQSITGQFELSYVYSTGVSFQIGYDPVVRLDISSQYTQSGTPASHPGGYVKIYNSSNQLVCSTFVSPPESGVYSLTEFKYLAPGTYTMVVGAQGPYIQTTCNLKRRDGLAANYQTVEKVVGGMRVKKVETSGYPDRATMVKRFYYGTLAEKTKSSAQYYTHPQYYATLTFTDGVTDGACSGLLCSRTYEHAVMNSTSLSRLYTADGKIVEYTSVLESIGGDNFENGVVEHKFNVGEDAAAQNIRGTLANLFSPFSNNSVWGLGETETVTYRNVNGSLVKANAKEYINYVDQRLMVDLPYYFITEKGTLNCRAYDASGNVVGPYPVVHQNFNINKYYLTTVWKYLKTQKEYQYDENGANPAVTQIDYEYNDLQYLTLSKRIFTNSKGEVFTENFTYPHNYSSLSPYDEMIARNMVETVVEQRSTITNSQYTDKELSKVKTNYAIFSGDATLNPSTIIKASSVEKSFEQSSPMDLEVTINSYDKRGNILQTTSRKEGVVSYVWGYKQKYPVAKVVGKSYNDVFSQSGLSDAVLNSSSVISDETIRTELLKLRQLTGCQVITNTYKYPYGTSSSSDINGKNTYYEYDQFGRLVIVRDHDQNVLKKMCYKYNGMIENCVTACVNTTANWVNTGNTRCQQVNCTYTGYQEIEQTDNNSCSPTYNQTQWILGAYDPTTCSGSTGNVSITFQNNLVQAFGNSAGWVITYTHKTTGQVYSFSIPSTGSGTLGCIPAGSYSVAVTKPGNTWMVLFSTGCSSMSGTSASFGKVIVSASACNTITLTDDMM